MDITPKLKKAMNNDEVSLLVELIRNHPILASKKTNARTNKIKEATWIALTKKFNAKSRSNPKTIDQLKFKWDNLKKAARKRSQKKKLIKVDLHIVKTVYGDFVYNNIPVPFTQNKGPGGFRISKTSTTGSDKPNISTSADEILDNVSNILDSTCTGFVPFDGDGTGSDSTEDTDDERPSVPEGKVSIETPNEGSKSLDYDARRAKNLAMCQYYKKKTEKLELEIRLLKAQLIKENRNRSDV